MAGTDPELMTQVMCMAALGHKQCSIVLTFLHPQISTLRDRLIPGISH